MNLKSGNLILIIVILIVLLLASLSIIRYFYNRYINEKSQKENTILLLGDKTKEIEVYRNKYENLVSKNETSTLDTKTIRELIDNGNLRWLKEFEGLKKSIKNLESAYNINLKIVDSLRDKLNFLTKDYVNEKGDTVTFSAFNWEYKDKWGEFSLLQITPDSVLFKRNEEVPISGVVYWKRKWFLGKKHYWGEAMSENPHIKISEFLNIKVQKEKN